MIGKEKELAEGSTGRSEGERGSNAGAWESMRERMDDTVFRGGRQRSRVGLVSGKLCIYAVYIPRT